MILKKLTLENFRSYYGKKEFLFGPKLNLILGSNGDGKSTLYAALFWILTYRSSKEEELPSLASMVSAKFFSTLPVNKPRPVRVTLEMETIFGLRKLVREFFVEKSDEGKMNISQQSYIGYRIIAGKEKPALRVEDILGPNGEGAFPAIIKRFSVLPGEEYLDVFRDPSMLSRLMNMYSNVGDLLPYKELAQFLLEKSGQAKKNTMDKRLAASSRAKQLEREIQSLEREEERLRAELTSKRRTELEMGKKIETLQADRKTIELIRSLYDEKKNLESMIESKKKELSQIKDFSVRLMDDMWILSAFTPVAEEFAEKIEGFQKRIQAIRDEHNQKIGEAHSLRKMLQAAKEKEQAVIAAIPGFRSEIVALRQMLSEHKCMYCGTAAPEGSDAYTFIKQKLDSLEEQLRKSQEEIVVEDPPPLDLGGHVNDYYIESKQILRSIKTNEYYDKFNRTISNIADIEDAIQKAYDRIRMLMTEIEREQSNSSSGLDLSQYVGDKNKQWEEWTNSYNDYTSAQKSIASIEIKLRETIAALKEKRDKYDAMVSNDKNRSVMDLFQLSSLFMRSLNAFEDDTYGALFEEIEKRANAFMRRITVDDFRGIISIEAVENDKLDIVLRDSRGEVITDPNKSLHTTKCISVILALAEYNQEKRQGNACPIILDAPTSSFDTGKERMFYQSLGTIESQCIIFTKSFLYKEQDDAKDFIVDVEGLTNIDANVFRIKKQREGFNQEDLSTIETIVETIKTAKP